MDQRKLLFQWQVPSVFLSEGVVAAKGSDVSAVPPVPGRGCCGTDGQRTDRRTDVGPPRAGRWCWGSAQGPATNELGLCRASHGQRSGDSVGSDKCS